MCIKDQEPSLRKEEKRLYCLHSFVGVSAEAFLPVSADNNKRKESVVILCEDSYFQDLLRSRNRFTIGTIR